MLPDGDHDALIVEATPVDGPEGAGADGAVRVELTLTSGPHKGEVVAVVGRFAGRDPLSLLGEPATLVVRDGRPDIRLG